jgi:ribosomal protein S18 acetylase RimI-like enzyme
VTRTTGADLVVESYDAPGLHEQRELILAVYQEIYADRLDDPFFSVPRYWERLEAYAARDGFALMTGRIADQMIGYTLGYALPAGSKWWSGLLRPLDPAFTEEDGHRTFALTEMMVREGWRRRGYARTLHDALMRDRTEQRATLLVRPDNEPARLAYLAWGWRKVGEIQPFPDAPVYDSMVLDLPSPSRCGLGRPMSPSGG